MSESITSIPIDMFQVGYILSLGVASSYRKQGIASLLLDQLISHLNSNYCNTVKALYLHVLTTNTQAIHFYEHRSVKTFTGFLGK